MALKLACADFTFPLLPHDKSLDLIAMLGFEGVDVGLFEGRSHLWPSRVFRDLKAAARARAGRCEPAKGRGVRFSVEAHVGSIVPPPDSAAALVRAVPGLTLTLDYT